MATVQELLGQAVQQYQPGGAFEQKELGQLGIQKKKALAKTYQGQVSRGLAGTSVPMANLAGFESDVGIPVRSAVESARSQGLVSALLQQAGYLGREQAATEQEQLAIRGQRLQDKISQLAGSTMSGASAGGGRAMGGISMGGGVGGTTSTVGRGGGASSPSGGSRGTGGIGFIGQETLSFDLPGGGTYRPASGSFTGGTSGTPENPQEGDEMMVPYPPPNTGFKTLRFQNNRWEVIKG